ncbi:MAG TPA: hypothetical protein VKE51_02035 [Vicinamibacterales bacterium]|nr:hypothetical protein [Vicinamibacterales bacterium]
MHPSRTGVCAAIAAALTIPLVARAPSPSASGFQQRSPSAEQGRGQSQSLVEYDDAVQRVSPNGVDFTGEWAPRFHEDEPERVPGPELGDYLGIPINDAARMRAMTWEASIQTLSEWQCRPHSADYIWRGPSPLRIWKDVDPVSRQVTAWHAEWLRSVDRSIYMDGRPHPSPNAPHTWAGFSTGTWQGDVLTIKTTHLKEGYVRRNGLPRSDQATLTEHWMLHGDVLTVAAITTDPVYLTEPFIRTTDYELDLHQWVPPYPCQVVEEVDRKPGIVPHSLPGTNNATSDFASRCGLPVEATRGGAETMYPDFRDKIGFLTSKCIAAQR